MYVSKLKSIFLDGKICGNKMERTFISLHPSTIGQEHQIDTTVTADDCCALCSEKYGHNLHMLVAAIHEPYKCFCVGTYYESEFYVIGSSPTLIINTCKLSHRKNIEKEDKNQSKLSLTLFWCLTLSIYGDIIQFSPMAEWAF